MPRWFGFSALLIAGFFMGGAVSWSGAFQAGRPPFRDAGEQREQIIHELQQVKSLLKEQNELLRTLVQKSERS